MSHTQEHSQGMPLLQKWGIVLSCALVYYALFDLNFKLFEELEFSSGVNWIFLPSGLRLLFVLIFSGYGAVGIVAGSALVNYTYGDEHNHVFNVVTAIISGAAPYLSRLIVLDHFGLSTDLAGMRPKVFFRITIIFALLSATLHQLWFSWHGQTQDFLLSTFVMFVGDWLGTVLVIALSHWLLKALGVSHHYE